MKRLMSWLLRGKWLRLNWQFSGCTVATYGSQATPDEKETLRRWNISTYPQDCAILLTMAIEGIIAQLDAEIERLREVRTLLSATGKVEAKISAAKIKPTKKAKVAKAAKVAPKVKTVKRVLSPEARKAIADAQRKRWAAQKAKA
jgi:hypothetical protein